MKKKTLFFSLFASTTILLSNTINAQTFYAGIGSGYEISLASQTMTYNETGFANTTHFYETVKGSYGKGISFGAFIGHNFNSNFGAELGFSYLAGGKTKRTYLKELSRLEEMDMSAKMIRIIPSLRMTMGEGKIKPYMKIGLVMGMGGKIIVNDKKTDIGCNCGNEESTWEYSGGISFGAAGAMGANYSLNEKLNLFGEIGFISQSWAPKNGLLTTYTFNGADQLGPLTTSQKEVDFVDNYTSSLTSNASEPTKQIKDYNSFSSVGINIGVTFAFGEVK